MEARRKGVAGRTVVTRNRRSNSGRSSRAIRCEGWVGWRARGSPLSLPFQIPERSSPSRVRCAAPTSRALDVSGPFRTRAEMRERGQLQRHNLIWSGGALPPPVGRHRGMQPDRRNYFKEAATSALT